MASPTWQIKLYGTRGSTPVCENGYQEYGGNTTCIYADLLTNDRSKGCIIFDAGTGIRRLGKEIASGVLPKVDNIFLIFTHFHWDHIQGLPFFDSIYAPGQYINVFAPREDMSDTRLREIFETQMQREYFPVQLDRAGADFKFLTKEKQAVSLLTDGGATLRYRLHNHPGGAFSYRLESNGKSVVICTDLEHGETIDEEVVEFCRGANLLIHDAQYTDEELKTHWGWGHSSYSQAIEVAKRAGVGKLLFTHHDPDHNDDFLSRVEKEYQAIFPNCRMARDGMEVLV